jgi:hypothetical protein
MKEKGIIQMRVHDAAYCGMNQDIRMIPFAYL